VVCITFCGLCWYKMSDEQIRERQRWLITGQNKIKTKQGRKTIIVSWVEKFFLGRLSKCSYTGRGRYIWGTIYLSLAIMLSKLKVMFLYFLVTLTIFGFIFNETQLTSLTFFMLICFFALSRDNVRWSVYSDMLICGGRRERFYGMIWSCIATSVVYAAAFVLLIVIAGQIVEFLAPYLAVAGMNINFTGFDMSVVYMVFCFVPVLLPSVHAFRKNRLLQRFSGSFLQYR